MVFLNGLCTRLLTKKRLPPGGRPGILPQFALRPIFANWKARLAREISVHLRQPLESATRQLNSLSPLSLQRALSR